MGILHSEGVARTYLKGVSLGGDCLRGPFLFKKLFDSFATLADCVGLPGAVYTTRIGLIQRGRAVDVETDDKGANAKGTSPAALSVFLLNASDISSDVPGGNQKLKVKMKNNCVECAERIESIEAYSTLGASSNVRR